MAACFIEAAYLRLVLCHRFMEEGRKVWIASARCQSSYVCQNRFHAPNRRVLRDQPECHEQRRCFASKVPSFFRQARRRLEPHETFLNETRLSRNKGED